MGVFISEKPDDKKVSHFNVTLTGENNTHTISTTLTSHPGVARDWLYATLHSNRRHRHNLVIGLGVQWTPYERNLYHHPAATIQLCIGKRCLIFHLTHADSSPRNLRRLLADPRNTFVGLWNFQDAKKLAEGRHQLDMVHGMPIDLRKHVEGDYGGRRLRDCTIEEIADQVLGVDVERCDEVARSDWDVEDLSLDQVQLAAVDAFVAFVIGVRIRAWELNPIF